MGASKRDYMELGMKIHDPLAEKYWKYIRQMVEEEQMIYETLCDTRSKDKE